MTDVDKGVIKKIFDSKVWPRIKGNASSQEEPKAFVLGGQPGAGLLKGVFEKTGGNLVVINGDEFRQYHPNFKEIQQEHGTNAAMHTASFSGVMTHVDYSARVQTVTKSDNARLADLLSVFKHKTGDSVLINTSFNVRGEPIVNTMDDAYICFMRTGMDVLALGNYIFKKADQSAFTDTENWREAIPFD